MTESQKLAERLIVLNDRCVGILTRLYNIKKSCGNVNSRPKALTEKSFEQAISIIGKKFPINDLKKHSVINTLLLTKLQMTHSFYRVPFQMLMKLKVKFLRVYILIITHLCIYWN